MSVDLVYSSFYAVALEVEKSLPYLRFNNLQISKNGDLRLAGRRDIS